MLFGEISNERIRLSTIGRAARASWLEIPNHFNNVCLDEYVVMPNHVHGIIFLTIDEKERAECIQPLQDRECQDPATVIGRGKEQRQSNDNVGVQYIEPSVFQNRFQHMVPNSIGSIIRSYKAAVTRRCRKDDTDSRIWQRNYYEHIIRNENELGSCREYIVGNPLKWKLDRENPASVNFNLGYAKYLEFE